MICPAIPHDMPGNQEISCRSTSPPASQSARILLRLLQPALGPSLVQRGGAPSRARLLTFPRPLLYPLISRLLTFLLVSAVLVFPRGRNDVAAWSLRRLAAACERSGAPVLGLVARLHSVIHTMIVRGKRSTMFPLQPRISALMKQRPSVKSQRLDPRSADGRAAGPWSQHPSRPRMTDAFEQRKTRQPIPVESWGPRPPSRAGLPGAQKAPPHPHLRAAGGPGVARGCLGLREPGGVARELSV